MLVRMRLVFILVLFFWVKCTSSVKCPAKYLRFNEKHTFCLKSNTKCNIKLSGVSKQDKVLILEYHNAFRNITAMGNETRAKIGTLPKAADMLQMVWDDELASIAQKWSDNCEFRYDCSDGCRKVVNFDVGQNLAIQSAKCSSKRCTKEEKKSMSEPDWASPLRDLYDEVLVFEKTKLDSYRSKLGDVGHFTQIIWSRSWRVGCGYTAYKEKDKYFRFYVCNYGLAGNSKYQPIYKEGKPCSACPVNTCCGESCGEKMDYPGLCKMLDPETAPIYPRETDDLLFFCDTSPETEDCAVEVTGTKSWKNIKSLSGNYDYIELEGGQSTTVKFENDITPDESTFCVRLIYRKGPSKAGEKDKSVASVETITASKVSSKSLKTSPLQFLSYNITFKWKMPSRIALLFAVPSGRNPHIFELKEILSHNGKCE